MVGGKNFKKDSWEFSVLSMCLQSFGIKPIISLHIFYISGLYILYVYIFYISKFIYLVVVVNKGHC